MSRAVVTITSLVLLSTFSCQKVVEVVEPSYQGYPPPPPYPVFPPHIYHHPPPPFYDPHYYPVPPPEAFPFLHYVAESPKSNCSVQEVVESVEVCNPAFETVCASVELPIKEIIDVEQCYPVTRTVCESNVEVVENEICTYSYQQKTEDTDAKTVAVTFERICNTQKVTVCQPTPGIGYTLYGHNYCKEIDQETCYNSPVVSPKDTAVTVAYPEPSETCVQKPIDLPRITCEDLTEEKCITVPEVQEAITTIEKCVTQLASPSCEQVELRLPKQVCKEINYGVGATEVELVKAGSVQSE